MGSESNIPEGKIILGNFPFSESNPFLLRIIFITFYSPLIIFTDGPGFSGPRRPAAKISE